MASRQHCQRPASHTQLRRCICLRGALCCPPCRTKKRLFGTILLLWCSAECICGKQQYKYCFASAALHKAGARNARKVLLMQGDAQHTQQGVACKQAKGPVVVLPHDMCLISDVKLQMCKFAGGSCITTAPSWLQACQPGWCMPCPAPQGARFCTSRAAPSTTAPPEA